MQKVCKHFVKGSCREGDNCSYIHDKNICRFYFLNGNCKKGDKCNFKHTHKLERRDRDRNNRNNRKKLIKKNTETFEPCYDPSDLRMVVVTDKDKLSFKSTSRDVMIVPNLFCEVTDKTLYEELLKELKSTGKEDDGLWKLWHGDTHFIADDHLKWKSMCPTFTKVVDKLGSFFNMDIKATRFNWYKDSSHWKPFHHDAAAVDPKKAKTQNLTVAVSFGATRDASFEHAKTKTRVTVPQPNGTVYTFGKDVNIEWRHGIPKIPDNQKNDDGRISIIAWGWAEQLE